MSLGVIRYSVFCSAAKSRDTEEANGVRGLWLIATPSVRVEGPPSTEPRSKGADFALFFLPFFPSPFSFRIDSTQCRSTYLRTMAEPEAKKPRIEPAAEVGEISLALRSADGTVHPVDKLMVSRSQTLANLLSDVDGPPTEANADALPVKFSGATIERIRRWCARVERLQADLSEPEVSEFTQLSWGEQCKLDGGAKTRYNSQQQEHQVQQQALAAYQRTTKRDLLLAFFDPEAGEGEMTLAVVSEVIEAANFFAIEALVDTSCAIAAEAMRSLVENKGYIACMKEVLLTPPAVGERIEVKGSDAAFQVAFQDAYSKISPQVFTRAAPSLVVIKPAIFDVDHFFRGLDEYEPSLTRKIFACLEDARTASPHRIIEFFWETWAGGTTAARLVRESGERAAVAAAEQKLAQEKAAEAAEAQENLDQMLRFDEIKAENEGRKPKKRYSESRSGSGCDTVRGERHNRARRDFNLRTLMRRGSPSSMMH